MRTLKAFAVLLALVPAAPPALAQDGSAAEAEVLARLAEEIRLLEILIADAEQRADPAARTTFDYELLRLELETVATGITHYLTGHRAQPRQFEQIDGNYGEQTGERFE